MMLRLFRYALILAILAGASFYLLDGKNPIQEVQHLYFKYVQADKLEALKRQKEAEWQARWRPSQDCISPTTNLKALECRNREENARLNFDRFWEGRLK